MAYTFWNRHHLLVPVEASNHQCLCSLLLKLETAGTLLCFVSLTSPALYCVFFSLTPPTLLCSFCNLEPLRNACLFLFKLETASAFLCFMKNWNRQQLLQLPFENWNSPINQSINRSRRFLFTEQTSRARAPNPVLGPWKDQHLRVPLETLKPSSQPINSPYLTSNYQTNQLPECVSFFFNRKNLVLFPPHAPCPTLGLLKSYKPPDQPINWLQFLTEKSPVLFARTRTQPCSWAFWNVETAIPTS